MKKLLQLCLLLGSGLLLRAGDVEFYLDYCRFYTPEGRPYVEVYLTVDGTSVSYKPAAGGVQASVHFDFRLLNLSDKDTTVTYFDNYNLLSMTIPEASEAYTRQGIVDMRRINTPPGKYLLQVVAKDNHDPNSSKSANVAEFEVLEATAGFAFSDLSFISAIKRSAEETVFQKNGFEIVPFGLNSAFIDQDKLRFYVELYRSNTVFPEDYYAKATVYLNNEPLMMYDYTIKKKPVEMDVFTGELDIRNLPSQTYHLHVKLFNAKNPEGKLLVKRFHVYNSRIQPSMQDYTNTGEGQQYFQSLDNVQLDYYIKTLRNLSTEGEARFARHLSKEDDKRNYLYTFFEKRVSGDQNIGYLWKSHLAALEYVNEQFGSRMRKGFETDRGRVFLMYGIPSDVERFPAEAMRRPYEIWKYDKLGAQTQVMFVFMDTDLATDEYQLIHSNKYGEVQNFAWQNQLFNNNVQDPQIGGRDLYEGNRNLLNGRQ